MNVENQSDTALLMNLTDGGDGMLPVTVKGY